MSEPSIMFVRPGAIRDMDKALLGEVGVVVVETDDPANVRLVKAGHDLPISAMLAAAGKAIGASTAAQEAFGRAIAEALKVLHGK